MKDSRMTVEARQLVSRIAKEDGLARAADAIEVLRAELRMQQSL